jgi:hypothetical protein
MKTDANDLTNNVDGVVFESVEQIILNQINAIESNTFDKKILLEIYQNL